MTTYSIQRSWTMAASLGAVAIAGAIGASVGCSSTAPETSAAAITDDAGSGAAIACGGGASLCGSSCVDLKDDNANCGACGKACANGEVCSQGACGTSCGGGTSLCGSSCADTKIDPENCGGCGTKCGNGEVCSNGKCGTTCDAEQTLCSTGSGAPYCSDTKTDNANCGACGNVCGQGIACTNGKCPSLTVTGGSYTLLDSIDGGPCSISGSQTASFTLLNERDASVDLQWVDYSCNEHGYGTAAANGSLNQGTYVTHVWRVRDDADGGFLGGFVLNSPDAFTVTAH